MTTDEATTAMNNIDTDIIYVSLIGRIKKCLRTIDWLKKKVFQSLVIMKSFKAVATDTESYAFVGYTLNQWRLKLCLFWYNQL